MNERPDWKALYFETLTRERNARRTRRQVAAVLAAALALGVVFTGRVAFSQATCAQTLPFGLVTFCPDAPALASDANANFGLLANWLNEKVGTRGNPNITTTGTLTAANIVTTGGVRVGDSTATCAAAIAGTLRVRNLAVEVCNGAAWLPVGPGATTTVSCATLRSLNASLPDGHYVLSAGGYQFSTECDMTNGGWTLIQAHAATLRTVESLNLTSYSGAYLPAGAARALATAATQARFQSGGQVAVSSSNGPMIVALRILNAGQEVGASWTVSGGFNAATLNFSCGTTGRYPDTYHACGSGGGLHMLGDVHSLTNSTNNDVNVWVK